MNNLHLNRVLSILFSVLLLVLLFPVQAFCSDNEANGTFTVTFDNIEKQVLENSPDVQDNKDQYNDSDQGYLSQYTMEKANYLIVWQIQSDYFQYNDLQQQLNANNAKVAMLQYQYDLLKLKQTFELATDQDVLNAQKALDDNQNSAQSLKNQMQNILKDFRYHFALGDNVTISVDGVSDETVDFKGIDYNKDLDYSIGTSYDIKIAYFGNDSEKYDKAISQFKSSFQSTYDNLRDAANTEAYDEKYAVDDQKTVQLAELKYNYGLLAKLDYLTAEYNYANSKINRDRDKDNLYKAYLKYRWAKRGVITN